MTTCCIFTITIRREFFATIKIIATHVCGRVCCTFFFTMWVGYAIHFPVATKTFLRILMVVGMAFS